MQHQKENRFIFQLINAVLHKNQIKLSESELDWNYIYNMCRYHKIDNLVAYQICNLEEHIRPPKEIFDKFKLSMYKGKAREAIQYTEQERITQIFEEHGIPNIPLKGSVLKYFYPSPDMRFMVDLDILCREEDMEKIGKLLSAEGYQADHLGGDHDVYIKEPCMSLEIHRRCYTDNEVLNEYFSYIWDRSTRRAGKNFTYDMTWDDFYLFLIGHMAKHFKNGGIGIRSLLDLLVFNQKLEKNCHRTRIEEILERANLLEIERKMHDLGRDCIQSDEIFTVDSVLLSYILESGLQGSRSNKIASQTLKNGSKTGNRLRILKRYIIPPFQGMVKNYPYIEKHPFLLPIAWVHRWIRKSLFDRKKCIGIIKQIFNRKNTEHISKVHREAGID